MQLQPLIVVTDVEASSRWYQAVLGLESAHGGPEYERLTRPGADADDFFLQLHCVDTDEHPGLFDAERPPGANGVAIWFRTEDFDAAVERATAAGADVLNGPLLNERARQRELWMRDPDGYVVVVASRMGDIGR
jgi:catechol 2,3-dioxygenase-like lactoylglutathione lyase family enzyme